MADERQVNNVRVYQDSAGFYREYPIDPQVDQIKAELAASDRKFSEYGGGFIDLTDNDYVAGTTVALAEGATYAVARDLSASSANTRLNRPFADWQPWDNSAKLVRARVALRRGGEPDDRTRPGRGNIICRCYRYPCADDFKHSAAFFPRASGALCEACQHDCGLGYSVDRCAGRGNAGVTKVTS